ncbi:hypothetical protein BC829DRAFT_194435 [Chytridium lagenaria]|nr:hypothetical protein BC829DRAFT_194435 [Chytridium lagenaria]
MSMKVERSTVDQVQARLEALSKKKELIDPAEAFNLRVKQAQEKERLEKQQKKDEKRQKKKQRQEEVASQQSSLVDDDIAQLMGFGKLYLSFFLMRLTDAPFSVDLEVPKNNDQNITYK